MSKVFEYILKFNGDTKVAEDKVTGLKGIMKTAAVAAGALFAADKILEAGKAVFEYATEISNLKVNIESLTGLAGASLNRTTGAVKAIADTFNTDVNEVLLAGNTISKQFGLNMSDSLELVKKGLASSANINGDFLDQVKEYSPHFKAAGLEAQNMIAIMSTSASTGIFSDKGSDLVKEAGLRLREMTISTTDALKGIGINSDRMQRDLAHGNITIYQAMQQVALRLAEFPAETAKVGTAIADIFGGPGEDAGLEFIKTLGTMDLSLEKVMASTTEAGKAQLKWADSQQTFHTIGAAIFGDTNKLILGVKTSLLNMANSSLKWIVGLANGFVDLHNESALFRGVIEGIGAVIKTVFEVGKFAVVGFFDLLKNAGILLRAVFTLDFKGVKAALDSAYSDLYTGFNEGAIKTGEAFSKAITNTITPRKKIELISIDGAMAEAAGVAAGTAMANGIKKALSDADLGLYRGKSMKPMASKMPGLIGQVVPPMDLSKTTQPINENNLLMMMLIENHKRYADAVASSAQSISSVFTGIGDAIGGAAGSWLDFAGRILSQIPVIITQITALANAQLASSMIITTGKQTEAAASAVAGAAALPFPLNIAAMIGAAASVIGLFATFKSMPKFAGGAYVSSPMIAQVGDAADGKGEWILNSMQMKGLVGSNRMQPASVRVTGDIRLRGRDMNIAIRQESAFQRRTGGSG
jgi:hypothetical protein